MKCLPTAFVFAVMLAIGFGQSRNEPFAEKPGSCPPALPVQICSQSCFSDSHCQGIGKCCSTSCGGTVCSRPVTMRQTVSPEKPGSCPAEPKGRWVCSPTCSVDSDCRGTSKCCKNRCGALACQKPDVELIESVDFSVVPLPEDRYNVLRNPYNVPRNPYVPRNPNVSPYYFYDRK